MLMSRLVSMALKYCSSLFILGTNLPSVLAHHIQTGHPARQVASSASPTESPEGSCPPAMAPWLQAGGIREAQRGVAIRYAKLGKSSKGNFLNRKFFEIPWKVKIGSSCSDAGGIDVLSDTTMSNQKNESHARSKYHKTLEVEGKQSASLKGNDHISYVSGRTIILSHCWTKGSFQCLMRSKELPPPSLTF